MNERDRFNFIYSTHNFRIIDSSYEILNKIEYFYGFQIDNDEKIVICGPAKEEDQDEFDNFLKTELKVPYGAAYLNVSELNVDHLFPKIVKEIDLRNYVQGKISYFELCDGMEINNGIDFEGNFMIHLADLLTYINSLDDIYNFDFDVFSKAGKFDKEFMYYLENTFSSVFDTFFLNESNLIVRYLLAIYQIVNDNYLYTIDDVKDSILWEMKFLNLADVNQRSKLVKVWFVEQYSQESNYYLYNQVPSLLSTYKSYAYELIDDGDILATNAIAYLDYEGAPFWPINYLEAEQLLKIIYASGDFGAANTLGYLYFYHNPHGDKPDYDNAFRYYSIAASAGIIEAKYKQADCVLNGYGCQKNKEFAYKIYNDLHSSLRLEFAKGDYLCKFADVAYRLAKLDYDEYLETNNEMNLNVAKYEIAEALYAIRKRYITIDYIGDDIVYKKISDLYSLMGFEPLKDDYLLILNENFFEYILLECNAPGLKSRYEVKVSDENEITLRLSLPKNSKQNILITLGECGKVIESKEIVITGYSYDIVKDKGKITDIERSYYYNDDGDFVVHMQTGKEEFYITSPAIKLDNKIVNIGEPIEMALLLLNNQKLCDYLPYQAFTNGISLKPNDRVLVKTPEKKEEEFTVFKVVKVFRYELDQPINKYGVIIDKLDTLAN